MSTHCVVAQPEPSQNTSETRHHAHEPDTVAQSDSKQGASDKKPDAASGPLASEKVVETHHSITIGTGASARTINYVAQCGYMEMPNYNGEHKSNVFYTAYFVEPDDGTRDSVSWRSNRPITFAFNGGPGSSSVWLHLGALGPRRVVMGDEGERLPPPYVLVDNEASWLDITDLVFIDPVTTGYSRPVEGENAKQFHGLREDSRHVGDFIRLYVTKHNRWPSPKFLAGESYGTTRCAALSGYLQDTYGMDLNGIVLISPILNFQTARFDVGNDTPYWLYLPTYTATAWYHKKIDPDRIRGLDAVLKESEEFASGEYLIALAKGSALTPSEYDNVARKLSSLTGLSVDYIKQCDLRPVIHNFTKELLRDEHRTVGRLDSRYVGTDRNSVGDSPDHDPSMTAILGPYTGALYEYVRTELEYENDLVYEILTGRVHPWSYGSNENSYVNVGETLRSAMTKNSDLKVLACSGYYDLATPYFAMDYTADHMQLDPSIRQNLTRTYYESGHMMYVRIEDLHKLKDDVAAFYQDTLK
ncbi:MAG: peptidase S10 [Phycisphaeraceae bacterium]|nr:peptidase S10 [Phycisphaeraceae bacterium]